MLLKQYDTGSNYYRQVASHAPRKCGLVLQMSNVPWCACACVQGGPKKWGHRLVTIIILSNLNRSKKFTGRFLGKFAVKRILNIPPHVAYVATLWNINVGKTEDDVSVSVALLIIRISLSPPIDSTERWWLSGSKEGILSELLCPVPCCVRQLCTTVRAQVWTIAKFALS